MVEANQRMYVGLYLFFSFDVLIEFLLRNLRGFEMKNKICFKKKIESTFLFHGIHRTFRFFF